jgi:hypothetical protein
LKLLKPTCLVLDLSSKVSLIAVDLLTEASKKWLTLGKDDILDLSLSFLPTLVDL